VSLYDNYYRNIFLMNNEYNELSHILLTLSCMPVVFMSVFLAAIEIE